MRALCQLVGDLVVEDFADGDWDDDAGIDERGRFGRARQMFDLSRFSGRFRSGFGHAEKMPDQARSGKEEIGRNAHRRHVDNTREGEAPPEPWSLGSGGFTDTYAEALCHKRAALRTSRIERIISVA
jgi:hypothetical protein